MPLVFADSHDYPIYPIVSIVSPQKTWEINEEVAIGAVATILNPNAGEQWTIWTRCNFSLNIFGDSAFGGAVILDLCPAGLIWSDFLTVPVIPPAAAVVNPITIQNIELAAGYMLRIRLVNSDPAAVQTFRGYFTFRGII